MKKSITYLLLLVLLHVPASFADGNEKVDRPQLQEKLLQALEDGEKKGKTEFQALVLPEKAAPKQNRAVTPQFLPSDGDKENDELIKLIDQVEKLKSQVVITRALSLNTSSPRATKKIGTKVIYGFREGQIYEVHAGVDQVTDIEFQPGEKLTNAPVSGDSVRWKVAVLSSGTEKGDVTHLILKPLEEGIETNLVITTDKRTYHLRALAANWYMPSVSWTYPDDEASALQEEIERRQVREPIGLRPEELNFEYKIRGDNYDWKPVRVFDDGKKTFIQMPKTMGTSEAPALFLLEEDNVPLLANYRVKGDFYILDRLLLAAELRVGEKNSVKIYSSRCKRSFLERLFS